MSRENIDYSEDKVIRNEKTGEVQWVDVDKDEFKKVIYNKNAKRSRERAIAREERNKLKQEKGREMFMKSIENKDTKKNNAIVNKGSSAYLSQENVKQFNREMQKRVFGTKIGRPYAFSNLDELQEQMQEYFDLCTNQQVVPTITSLALWLGVDRDRIYDHANNPNSPFSGVMKNTINYLHSIMQSGTIDGKINPVTYIFISKNDYGMRDDKNITVTPTISDSKVNSQETMDAIQKQLQEENIANAEYTESD